MELIGFIVLILGLTVYFLFFKGTVHVVYEHEKGLFYRNGKIVEVVGTGRYIVRNTYFVNEEIRSVDMRDQSIQITGQELLSADRLNIKVNILVSYKITDAEKAINLTESYTEKLYQIAQIEVRHHLQTLPLDEIFTKRNELNIAITKAVQEQSAEYGLEVASVLMKDINMSESLKNAYSHVAEAKKQAEAALVGARDKVASTRALINAANMMKENPMLLELQKLEFMKQVADGNSISFVVKLDGKETEIQAK